MAEALVTIISHKRPQNVKPTQDITGPATWFVGKGEVDAYLDAGAHAVVESGGLCQSRNEALRHAFEDNRPCVQVSDDLRKLQAKVWDPFDRNKRRSLDFQEALRIMANVAEEHFVKLVGASSTGNPGFSMRPVTMNQFIVADLIYVKPCDLYFDESLKLKEDYDYTLQHMRQFGGVARCDTILPRFRHRDNEGGAVSYRTSDLEKETIAHLKKKWPGAFKDNPKRPDEILLRMVR